MTTLDLHSDQWLADTLDLSVPKGKRAAIYLRISKAELDDLDALNRQEEDCRAWVAANGYTVIDVYSDHARSAWSDKVRRLEWERLLRDMRAGEIDVLVAWHTDRFSRNDALTKLIDVVLAKRITVHTVRGGQFDLRTPAGQFQARMLNEIARYESAHKSDRVRRSVDQRTANGKRSGLGGRRQFGFELDGYTIVPAEQAALHWAAEALISGQSLRQVAANMRVPTVTGAPWQRTTLRNAIIAPSVAGLVEVNALDENGDRIEGQRYLRVADAPLGKGGFPALIPRDLWELALAHLSDPKRKHRRPMSRYLLTGLVVDRFGRNLTGKPDRGRRIYLTKREKVDGVELPGTTIACLHLDAQVNAAVRSRGEDMRLRVQQGPTAFVPSSDLEERKIRLAAERQAALADYKDKLIDHDEYRALARGLKEELDGIAAEEAAIRDAAGDATLAARMRAPGAFAAWWDAVVADPDQFENRRNTLEYEIKHVEIGEGDQTVKGYDPDRVTIWWWDGTFTTYKGGEPQNIEPITDPLIAAKVSRVMGESIAAELAEQAPRKRTA